MTASKTKEQILDDANERVKLIEKSEKQLLPLPTVFKALMKEKGLSGYDLEKGCGFTRQTVQHFTTGRGTYPSMKVLSKACVMFGIKLSDFFKRVEKCSS